MPEFESGPLVLETKMLTSYTTHLYMFCCSSRTRTGNFQYVKLALYAIELRSNLIITELTQNSVLTNHLSKHKPVYYKPAHHLRLFCLLP